MNKVSNIDELINQSQDRVEQLKRRKILQDNKEKEKQDAINTRRYILIGKLICKYFPEVLKLQPRLTKAENNIEFKLLEVFISILADDKEYIGRIKQQATTRGLPDN